MPLFQIEHQTLKPVEQSNFLAEKRLQALIEANLDPVFKCRFVATEFNTGPQHGGRIDTLALSEDDNPVIIEYKKVESSELVNQSLFYLSWINDHKGDFEIAAQRAIGSNVKIDWSAVRVICIAPNYKKYDLHAVQMMHADIELWTYRLYKNDTIHLEEVLPGGRSAQGNTGPTDVKNPIMVEAGKKAAQTRLTGVYSFDGHLEGKSADIHAIALAVQEFIARLDPAIEEAPKKNYIAYRTTQNIVCMEVQQRKVYLFLKLDPTEHPGPPGLSRDVSETGHFGTGDLEVTIRTLDDLDLAKPFIELAYRRVGS